MTTASTHLALPAGDVAPIGIPSTTDAMYEQLRVRPFGSATRAATITIFARAGNTAGATTCRVSAQALVSG